MSTSEIATCPLDPHPEHPGGQATLKQAPKPYAGEDKEPMATKRKTVSVVMATYNGEKYIEEQLRSIINQTYQPLEIIVSDDASRDSTLDVVNRLASDCKIEIRIVRNEKPLGFRDNFLRASLLAQGNFIAFCDQDDVWDARKLEKCSEFFTDPNISMIVHAATLVDGNAKKIGTFKQGIRRSGVCQPLSYDPWLTFFGFSIVFRRELLDLADINERFIDYIVPTEMIAHDRWIMFLGQMVGSTAEIAEPLVKYRQHGNNTFGHQSKKKKGAELSVRQSTKFYIDATSRMLDIVDGFPEKTGNIFPQFNKKNSISFLRNSIDQLEMRLSVYDSPTQIGSAKKIYRCMERGGYRSVHDGRYRWRSLGRDLQFALLRR